MMAGLLSELPMCAALVRPGSPGTLRRASRTAGLLAALALMLAVTSARAQADAPPAVEPRPAARPATLPGLTAELGLLAEAPAARRWGWVVGASLNDGPTYSGSSTHALRVRPLWGLQYGHLRLSTSGAGAVMGFGGDGAAAGSGASLQMVDSGRWKVGASLRLDGGRSASDDPSLAGLPEIRRTLRGRLQFERRVGARWSAGLGVSQDLLGRGGGATASAGIGRGFRLRPDTEGSIGLGTRWGSRSYMAAHYGVPAQAAVPGGRRAFSPGSGLIDVSVGGSVTTALTPHWIAFAGAGGGRLVGDAADSPLTRRATSWHLSAGLAYRCCKP